MYRVLVLQLKQRRLSSSRYCIWTFIVTLPKKFCSDGARIFESLVDSLKHFKKYPSTTLLHHASDMKIVSIWTNTIQQYGIPRKSIFVTSIEIARKRDVYCWKIYFWCSHRTPKLIKALKMFNHCIGIWEQHQGIDLVPWFTSNSLVKTRRPVDRIKLWSWKDKVRSKLRASGEWGNLSKFKSSEF